MEKQSKKSNRLAVLTNGLLHENPNLRLVLGTCPTHAITTTVFNSLGMGIAATFVLSGGAALVFSAYLARFSKNYVTTYAGLATGMIALVFLYFCAVIFLFGGEINAAIRRAQQG